MNFFSQIDDRFLMVCFTVAVIVAYAATKDAVFAEMLKYTLGATFGVLITRANKVTIATDSQVHEAVSNMVQK